MYGEVRTLQSSVFHHVSLRFESLSTLRPTQRSLSWKVVTLARRENRRTQQGSGGLHKGKRC